MVVGDRVTIKDIDKVLCPDGRYRTSGRTRTGTVIFLSRAWGTVRFDKGYCESFYFKRYGGDL